MKERVLVGAIICFVVSSEAVSGRADSSPVTTQEEAGWLRRLIPLPKEVRIERKVVLPASDVRLRVRSGAGDVEKNAADKLSVHR